MDILKRVGRVASDNYPETMGQLMIVNAPMFFTGIWHLCKGFMDERT